MDFFEAEGKRLLAKYGIPTDEGFMLSEEADYVKAVYPCVVKAQVLSGHRGQAGGIKLVKSEKELREEAARISKLTIGGKQVEGLLVVPAMKIVREYYLGLTMDTVSRRIVLLFSACGGMDIEQVAKEQPDMLLRMDATKGVDSGALGESICAQGVEKETAETITAIAEKLYKAYCELDATTLELNPLAYLEDGSLVAADCKLVIDENSLNRQGDYTFIHRPDRQNPLAVEAAKIGISYVEVNENGNIGIIAGGAGIGMATVDTVKTYGLEPFNFMDLGTADADKTYLATKFLLQLPQVKAVIFNVFGGFNNCRLMAVGITRAIKELDSKLPVVVKSRGNSQEEGWKILADAGIPTVKYGTTDEAVLILKELEAFK